MKVSEAYVVNVIKMMQGGESSLYDTCNFSLNSRFKKKQSELTNQDLKT